MMAPRVQDPVLRSIGIIAFSTAWLSGLWLYGQHMDNAPLVAEEQKRLRHLEVLSMIEAEERERWRAMSARIQSQGNLTPSRSPGDAFSQTSSTLLARLPFELREMIWKECLGDMIIQLQMFDPSYQFSMCTYHGNMWECDNYRNSCSYCRPSSALESLMALLLTCRQTFVLSSLQRGPLLLIQDADTRSGRYCEAIQIFHSCNQLKASKVTYVAHLPQILLPQRLNTVRAVHLEWVLNLDQVIFTDYSAMSKAKYQPDRLWRLAWSNIAAMEGLRNLDVKLVFTTYWRTGPEQQSVVFEPMKAVTRPGLFNLWLETPI